MQILKISPEHIEEAQRATATSKKFGNDKQVPVSTQPSGVGRPATAPAASTTATEVEQFPVVTEVQN